MGDSRNGPLTTFKPRLPKSHAFQEGKLRLLAVAPLSICVQSLVGTFRRTQAGLGRCEGRS